MKDIMETITSDASLSTLATLLENANLVERLKGSGPYTLFAPNNDAFVRMNIGKNVLDPKNLSDTLTYHLVAGKHSFKEIQEMMSGKLETETGKYLTVEMDEGEMVVDNGKFVTSDIECSNGVIHIIDNVFQPQLSGWYREDL
ncbi:MAG: fasciclin domain-containing protein [Deltaproteobacteria bacterium]|nr:fasciclin domain-containing protein [Deltaproteobacteria bacterium]